MQALRAYQAAAIDSVRAHWASGIRSVCLVAPTGSGKTRMGEELVDGTESVLWLAHRRELINQAAHRLALRFGKRSVGVIMPGEYETPKSRIQVATPQTLLARKQRVSASVLALDEAHHYMAEHWRTLAEAYPNARAFGLTATPERGDGEPLGDVFGEMVVAAKYSELIAAGHLVSARVYRPSENLGNDLAQDPLEAWKKCSEGSRSFVFCARVDGAFALAQRFRDAGISAGTIECNTPKRDRDDLLERFRRGTLTVLTNVNTLTEGVDVPEARCVILARSFGHVGGFLQAAGRALRPAKGKPDAIVVDLTGSTIRHGLPTDDRQYSLSGRAISGTTAFGGGGERPDFTQSVRGLDLHMVAAGALKRGEKPAEARMPDPVSEAERKVEYERLLALAKQHRMRSGFAAAKYHEKFGKWPSLEWTT